MALKKLIENQTIIIDDHKRGAGEVKNWNDPTADLHIDKKTNFPVNGKRQEISIKIPINSERPPKIEYSSGATLDEIPRVLKREIQDAFRNRQKRERFVKDVVKFLRNFGGILENEVRARQVFDKISEHFELNWTQIQIAEYSGGDLVLYTEKFTDREGRRYSITADKDKIKVGENTGFASHETHLV